MWLKTDLLVGNSGALDICCLIKRSKTHAYMRTLFDFARNCGYLRDSTGFVRANCGLAKRRKSTNFTYYQRLVSTKMWRKHSSGANSGSVQTQAILAGWELLTEPSGLPNQWPQNIAGTCAGCATNFLPKTGLGGDKEELDMQQTSRTSTNSCAGTGTSSAVSVVYINSAEFGYQRSFIRKVRKSLKSAQIPKQHAKQRHKTRKQAFEQKKVRKRRFRS